MLVLQEEIATSERVKNKKEHIICVLLSHFAV